MSHNLSTKASSAYDRALEQLYKISFFRRGQAINYCTHLLDRALDFPARAYPAIHVAGTNGKGSVATKIARALQAAGYRVGLFTSPHLLTFCERIQVSGEMISEEAVASGLESLFVQAKQLMIKPTFFEYVTNLACMYFKEQEVDVAVFEVGLGGKTDATNVIRPILSVITSIGHDHNWVLGETLDLIAEQKAGIIREKVPVILGPTAHFEVIERIAREKQAPLIYVDKQSGNFEDENRQIAKTCLEVLKQRFALTEKIIDESIMVMPPCRLQENEHEGHTIVMDAAHNADAIERLLQALAVRYPGRALQVIFGLSKDKDFAGCFELLTKKARRIYLPKIEHDRMANPQELMDVLVKMQYQSAQILSPEESLQAACENANDDLILICGSFYLMEAFPNMISSSSVSA